MPQLDTFTYSSFFKFSLFGLFLVVFLYFLYQARILGMEEIIKRILAAYEEIKKFFLRIRSYFGE